MQSAKDRLIEAVKASDEKEVETILSLKDPEAGPDVIDHDQQPILITAIRSCHLNMIRLLLSHGAKIANEDLQHGANALLWALGTEDQQIIKIVFTDAQVTRGLIQDTFKDLPAFTSTVMLLLEKALALCENKEAANKRLSELKEVREKMSKILDQEDVEAAVTEFYAPKCAALSTLFAKLPLVSCTEILDYSHYSLDRMRFDRFNRDDSFKRLYREIYRELKKLNKFLIYTGSLFKISALEDESILTKTPKQKLADWIEKTAKAIYLRDDVRISLNFSVLYLQCYYVVCGSHKFEKFFIDKIFDNLFSLRFGGTTGNYGYVLPYLLNALPPMLKHRCQYLSLNKMGMEFSTSPFEHIPTLLNIAKSIISHCTLKVKNACILEIASYRFPMHFNGNAAGLLHLLLDAGADPKAKNSKTNLLIEAAKFGCPKLMSRLLSYYVPAEINQVNSYGQTVLLSVMSSLNFKEAAEVVKLLLEAKADPNQKACFYHSQEFFGKGDNDYKKDKNVIHPLLVAADRCEWFQHFYPVAESKSFDVNVCTDEGTTALMIAADDYDDRREDLRFLLQRGININAQDKNGMTALQIAARRDVGKDSLAHFNYLLEQGADCKLCDNKGRNVLMHLAKSKVSKETVNLLIQKGLDINAQDKNGWTALMHAASDHGSVSVLRCLLESGADYDLCAHDGTSVLTLAAKEFTGENIKLLCQKGMNINAKDKKGWTPIMHVAAKGNHYMFNCLSSLGADFTVCTPDGDSLRDLIKKSHAFEKRAAIEELKKYLPQLSIEVNAKQDGSVGLRFS